MPNDTESALVDKELKPRRRTSIAVPVVLALAFAVVCIMLLLNNITLTRLSTENAILMRSITQENETKERLLLEYERTFNLTEIEADVTAKMGMRKVTERQEVYIGADPSDNVQILNGGVKKEGILGKLTDWLNSLM